MSLEQSHNAGIVLGALAALGDEHGVGQAEFGGGGDAGRLCHIRDDDYNFDAGKSAFADGFSDGKKVRPPAGKENAEADFLALSRRIRAHVYCTRRSPFTTRPTT